MCIRDRDLTYFDDEKKQKYIPYVIEPSLGADRVVLAFLCSAYDEEVLDAEKNDVRTVLHFHPAPVSYTHLDVYKRQVVIPDEAFTLYVAETDAEGNLVDGTDGFRYAVTVENGNVLFDENNLNAEVTIINQEQPEATPTVTPEETIRCV